MFTYVFISLWNSFRIWSSIVTAFNAAADRQVPSTRDSLSRLIGNMKSRESRSTSETLNATDELSVDFVTDCELLPIALN